MNYGKYHMEIVIVEMVLHIKIKELPSDLLPEKEKWIFSDNSTVFESD